MKKTYLEAGKIVGTHGVHGELRVDPWCDSPEVFARLKTLYLGADGSGRVAVKSRPHGRIALCRMDGVETVEDAEALRGTVLYLHRDDLALREGAYFIADLIGMRVLNATDGARLGTITEVSHTGANDVYHMKAVDGREILIPAIPAIVTVVDTDAEEMRITPMKGLLDDETV